MKVLPTNLLHHHHCIPRDLFVIVLGWASIGGSARLAHEQVIDNM